MPAVSGEVKNKTIIFAVESYRRAYPAQGTKHFYLTVVLI